MSSIAVIVEDNATSADIASRQLSAIGFSTQTADSAETGWDIIQKSQPDLVVIDERLPDTSGIELARTVRAHMPEITIVMCTIVDDERSIQSAFAAGCDYYAIKPNGLRKLCADSGNAEDMLSLHGQHGVAK